MRRFILPLLAALAVPTAANAETVYLVIQVGGDAVTTVPMKSIDQCEEAGATLSSSKRMPNAYGRSYECIYGK